MTAHVFMAVAIVTTAAIWVRSWFVEDEFRWMHDGTHRHLELACGTITYVVTTGWSGNDYIAWVASPNLSFRRDPDWYVLIDPSHRQWHLRVVWPVIAAVLAVLIGAAVVRLRGIWQKRR